MSLYIPLDREASHRLQQLARQNRRHPRDEAVVILEHYLGLRSGENEPAKILQFVGKDSQEAGEQRME